MTTTLMDRMTPAEIARNDLQVAADQLRTLAEHIGSAAAVLSTVQSCTGADTVQTVMNALHTLTQQAEEVQGDVQEVADSFKDERTLAEVAEAIQEEARH